MEKLTKKTKTVGFCGTRAIRFDTNFLNKKCKLRGSGLVKGEQFALTQISQTGNANCEEEAPSGNHWLRTIRFEK